MSGEYLLFVGICLLNPSLTNIGMGFQKLTINRLPDAGRGKQKNLLISIWILGLLFQAVVVALSAKALSIGNASTLGGFAGFGLVALALFSHFVLKEEILRRELAGMLIIIAGTALLGFFSHAHQSGIADFEQRRMTLFLIAFCLATAGLVVFMLRDIRAYGGVILGVIGGAIGGLAMIFMKILVTRFAGAAMSPAMIAEILKNPYMWMMVAGGIGCVVLVQIGYKFGKAIQVVPGFSSMVVIMPAVSGYLVLREAMPPVCVVSLLIITAGVLVTTTTAPARKST